MDLNQKQKIDEMKDCYLAIKNNKLDQLARCVEKYGVDAGYDDGTLLHQAIFQNNIEAVKYLLSASANSNALYDQSVTPLIAAIDDKRWNIARLLIENGADVNLKDANNNSPLSKAIFHFDGDASLIEMLLRHGADPYQDLLNGYTPMDLAKSKKLANMMQSLIDKNKHDSLKRDESVE